MTATPIMVQSMDQLMAQLMISLQGFIKGLITSPRRDQRRGGNFHEVSGSFLHSHKNCAEQTRPALRDDPE